MAVRVPPAPPPTAGGTARARASATARCGSRDGSMQLVEAEPARPIGTTPRARAAQALRPRRRRTLVARLIAAAPIAPIVDAGNANTPDCPSNAIIPITIEPNPYALRRVTCELRRGRQRLRREHARAAAQDRRAAPTRCPACTPGLSARKTSGRWNESATVMKCAALSAPSASIEPGEHAAAGSRSPRRGGRRGAPARR